MSESIISIRQLSKKYRLGLTHDGLLVNKMLGWFTRAVRPNREKSDKDLWALRDISCEINVGDVVGLIGNNGAGKSTLLKILSRITEPTSGEIELKGRVASLLEVGTGFHPELTGRENVFLNGAILGMSRDEVRSKFDEIVAFAEIDRFIDTPVKRYSSGMYIRLAFAVAAHLEPEILIIDEVLAVGDFQFQNKCLGKMKDVSQTGRTVLFVSHNMTAIRQLCDKAILLTAGEIDFEGDVGDCIKRYVGAGFNQQQRIVDHIGKLNDDVIAIDDVTVNGISYDFIEVRGDTPTIEINVVGELKRDLPIDIEIQLTDSSGTPLAFFSPSHETGDTQTLMKGAISLHRRFSIPCELMSGEYDLHLYLTHANVEGWVDIPSAARIHYLGSPSKSGEIFRSSASRGWLFLHDESE